MKVIDLEIDPDIELSGKNIDKMPESIEQPLLATITRFCATNDCHWQEVTWRVVFVENQPVIYVNKK